MKTDWLFQDPIDLEHKQLNLLGYLQKLDRFGIIEWIYELDEEDYFLKSTPAIGQNNIVCILSAAQIKYPGVSFIGWKVHPCFQGDLIADWIDGT